MIVLYFSLRKWQRSLLDFDETDFEETEDLVTNAPSSSAEEETAERMAAAAAATSHLMTTSEQEERRTFVITGKQRELLCTV